MMGRSDGFLGGPLSRLDMSYLFGRLHHSLFIERVRLRMNLIAEFLEPRGMTEGKIGRY